MAMAWLVGLWLVLPAAWPARAAELTGFEVTRGDDGLWLSYAVDLDLSHSVDDALNKAVPLYFVAEASVFRQRWYWADRREAHAVRVWRIVYQPLTSNYRVTFGGLSQNYDSRAEALAAISHATRWKVAEPGQLEPGDHYIEFSLKLDTSLLPRPMQIGINGQADWTLSVERKQPVN
ncbi:MAG: DUF4390 domain-containing protein [Proteobacteria bacterium]|nr:DUF4390 domain-containing protein [Pseudomonadota bacterium]